MHWNIDLSSLQTILDLFLSLVAVVAFLFSVWKIVVKAVAHQIAPVQTAVRRAVESTEQLRHNGGSHVADYARDARNLSLDARNLSAETLERVRFMEQRVTGAAEDARVAAALAREARVAAYDVARDMRIKLDDHCTLAEQRYEQLQNALSSRGDSETD